MSGDLIIGKRGTGKSKLAVMLIREHMLAGRRVATNLDVFPDKLLPAQCRATLVRVPDKPKAADLLALGDGNNGDAYNEDHNGLLVLDELGTWMNSRSFADPDRAGVLDWLVHSRKYGWEFVFICHDLSQIDKQMRESFVEYTTRCVRMDRVRVPVIGPVIASLLGEKAAQLPKGHAATRRLGIDPKGLMARRWWYRDGGVQAGYNTRQVFSAGYAHGAHSVLSAWHVVGRHAVPRLTLLERLKRAVAPRARPPLKPKRPEVAAVMLLPSEERIRALLDSVVRR